MATVVGISAYLQAKNSISPELKDIIQMSKNSTKELLQMDKATEELVKEMKRMKQAAEQNERSFKREMDKMQRETEDMRRQLMSLGSVQAQPKVSIDDQARREISSLRQELKSLDGTKATVEVGANDSTSGAFIAGGMAGGIGVYSGQGLIDQIILATQANARYSLLGGTSEDILQFQKLSQELNLLNPNIDPTQVKDLMTQAMRFNPEGGSSITRQSLQLNAMRPDMGGVEEFQMTMFAMQNAWKEITDVGRFGDTLAEITRTTTDIRGEALDSIIEYSTQVTKFLDTPEKLAALTKEMNELWSLDKGFDALKETTLKLYNQGDLTNVLKTAYETQGMSSENAQKLAGKEAGEITKLINSGSIAERQFAVGALMQQLGSIKDDKVRQNLLNELGAGPGEDLNTELYAKLIEAAGRISATDSSKYNLDGTLERDFKTFTENDPLRGFIEAKALLANEMTDLGVVIAQDLEPSMQALASFAVKAKGFLDELPPTGTIAVLGGSIVGVIAAFWGLKVAVNGLGGAIIDQIRGRLGGSAPDVDLPEGKKNRKNGGGGDDDPPKPKYQSRSPYEPNYVPKEQLERMNKGKPSWIQRLKENLGGKLSKKDTLVEVIDDVDSSKGILKSLGGGITRKLPYIGTAVGLGGVLLTGDKTDLFRLGAETVGGVGGGAAMGAMVGSIVPGLGTAIGAALGSVLGGLGGGWVFDNIKEAINNKPVPPPIEPKDIPQIRENIIHPAWLKPPEMALLQDKNLEALKSFKLINSPVKPSTIPAISPAQPTKTETKLAALTVQAMPITLKADGVLQDVGGMLRLLRDPSVSNEIKRMIEKAFIDAYESRGGAAKSGTTQPGMGSAQ